MAEMKPISELRGDPKNPRRISREDFAALQKSIVEFGDLSGIILNTTTNELVGGHQRIKAFETHGDNAKIEIVQRLEQPTKTGTVAIGFVMLDGERYAYREVQWDKARQQAANIAANRIQGEWNQDLLAEVTYEIQQQNESLLSLTGQSQKEIDQLMKSIGVIDDESDDAKQDDPDDDRLSFKISADQRELIMRALDHVRATRDIPTQDGGAMNGAALYYMAEQYLAAQPAESVQDTFTPPEPIM